ncbi:GrpB family protein [Virgibacillus doumboii]|uniref:GrpB family protein n=1 Tax=Virgibacillus doumboii TaxID=2697503 RepID=UPI001FE6CBAC|nr:GrpB family protein [Virgibacillus doumboii]
MPITLLDYNSDWLKLFEQESKRIRSIPGNMALQVEYVESTPVSGLCAKPIIDILLVVPDSSDEEFYVCPMKEVGYTQVIF